MRKSLIAVLATLAVVGGLAVSTGTAFADGTNDNGSGGVVGGVGNTVGGLVSGVTGATGTTSTTTGTSGSVVGAVLPPCTVVVVSNCHPNGDHHHPGGPGFPGGPRGGNFGHGFGFPIGGYQGLPGLINGNLLNLQLLGLNGVNNVSVCSYPTWDSFNTFGGRFGGRWGGVRGHFGSNPAAAWAQLRAEAACNAAVVNGLNGLTLVDGSYLNLGGEFGTVNVCSYSNFTDFGNRFGGRFGNRFGGVRGRFGGNPLGAWNQLRSQASCGTTVVVVPSSTTVVQAPTTTLEAAPADPSVTAPSGDDGAGNPQPLASSPGALQAPSAAPSNGGDSPAFTLLWPWA